MRNLRTKLCAAMGALTLLGSVSARSKAMDVGTVLSLLRIANMLKMEKVVLFGGAATAAYIVDQKCNDGKLAAKMVALGNNAVGNAKLLLHIGQNGEGIPPEEANNVEQNENGVAENPS